MKFLKLFLAMLLDERGWTTEMVVTGIAEVDAAIPNFWADGIVADGQRESFWGQLAGKEGSMLPVIDKTGQLKQKGDYITFNTIAQLMGNGVTGESVLKGQEEKLAIGSFSVSADIVRHAVAITRKATLQANFDVVRQAGLLLKDWFARKLDGDIFSDILSSSAITTTYAGSATTEAGLNATDAQYFGPSEISKMRLALQRQGATPFKVNSSKGRKIPVYGMVFGEIEEYYLSQNTAFNNQVRDAWKRYQGEGDDNPIFNGAIGIYDNMLLYNYRSILPIPQGTPLRPETTLSATLVTAGTTAYVGVAGSANTDADYTLFFASSGSLQIGDEIISYSGKTVSTFTGLTRGASSTTAVQHAAGALVTQRNVSSVIGFGAGSVYRAFPEEAKPVGDNDDYGAQIGIGIEAYYGHSVFKDALRGKSPGLVIMKCFSKNPISI
jgi:N4-gp56 family major capsid protein